MSIERRGLGPLLALTAILAITAAWWALALWPLPEQAPDWLARTRLVCFGAERDTLPSSAGWLLLIGEPAAMLGTLAVLWGDGLRAGLRGLFGSRPGRAVLGAGAAAVLLGLGAAARRVLAATAAERFAPVPPAVAAIRLDGPAPPLDGLVDQQGQPLSLARFRGAVLLVTFAYGSCATVCPLIVRDALAARSRVQPAPVLVVVTLDPWRDAPSRLPTLAASWHLGEGAYVASGSVTAVERVLDAWGVARTRDMRTGEITHPALLYIVDRRGRLAYQTAGDARATGEALARVHP